MPRTAHSSALFDEIRRILDTPRPYSCELGNCICAECTRLRATTMRCETCGYVGAPLVYPCHCDDERETGLRFLGERLAESERKGRVLGHGPKWWRAQIAAALTDPIPPLCAVDGREQRCSHTGTECPVCNMDGSEHGKWVSRDNRLHAWTIIRELRELLAQRER